MYHVKALKLRQIFVNFSYNPAANCRRVDVVRTCNAEYQPEYEAHQEDVEDSRYSGHQRVHHDLKLIKTRSNI